MVHKYNVGCWLYGTQEGDLFQIIGLTSSGNIPTYDAELFSNTMTPTGLESKGIVSHVFQSDLHLIQDHPTLLLCLAGEIRRRQFQAQKKVDNLKATFDGLIDARVLLMGEK